MAPEQNQAIHIIGGGLAGSEAAWQIAARGVPVVVHEMRPSVMTAAHKTDALAELVCSNSFRSDDREHNAVGLLHAETRRSCAPRWCAPGASRAAQPARGGRRFAKPPPSRPNHRR